ncbi:MAG: diaminopimelate decarboxylase, partial [Bacteroidota bacterium]|nr:diaminopimelate decarboxylase [Bacteroidota bacterium]
MAINKLADLMIGIKNKYNHYVSYVDLGGGFTSKNTLKGAFFPGVDTNISFDEYAEAIANALIANKFDHEHLPLLILESGRALIDDAGFLVGTVLANKRLSLGKRATIIDAGVNILFTSLWYDHKFTPAQEFTQYYEDTIIYGPLCMNIDIIRENMCLPLLNRGDNYVIHNVGAYNMTQWMQFISLRPKIVMIDTESNVHIIRENESMNSITALERLPEHLN